MPNLRAMVAVVIAVMILIGVSFDLGVKVGRRAESLEIGLHMVKKMGYDSIEEWEAAMDEETNAE